MPTAMLSNRTILQIRRLQLDLFETGFKMANPSISVVLSRYNTITQTFDDLPPQRVMVRWRHDKKLIRVYGSMNSALANSPTPLDGMFLAYDDFNARTGDRFTFQGVSGRINTVWPPRNGKTRASFTVESDKRPV